MVGDRQRVAVLMIPQQGFALVIRAPELIGGCRSPNRCAKQCKRGFGFVSHSHRPFRFGIAVNRRPVRDARRKREPCLGRVAEKSLVFSLRSHRIAMVQPAESRKGLNLAFAHSANFCCTTCWRVLRESKMRPVLMVQLDNATVPNENAVWPGMERLFGNLP